MFIQPVNRQNVQLKGFGSTIAPSK